MINTKHQVLFRLDHVHLLRRIAHRRALADIPLYRGQPPLLDYILRHPGCTQAELAERFLVSPASVAQSAKRLERAGYLEKREDAGNRRVRLLYVTQAGAAVITRCNAQLDCINERMLAGLNEEELAQLDALLLRIWKNAAPIAGVDPDANDSDSFFALLQRMHSEEIRKDKEDD